jgi:hypothetical protein
MVSVNVQIIKSSTEIQTDVTAQLTSRKIQMMKPSASQLENCQKDLFMTMMMELKVSQAVLITLVEKISSFNFSAFHHLTDSLIR